MFNDSAEAHCQLGSVAGEKNKHLKVNKVMAQSLILQDRSQILV